MDIVYDTWPLAGSPASMLRVHGAEPLCNWGVPVATLGHPAPANDKASVELAAAELTHGDIVLLQSLKLGGTCSLTARAAFRTLMRVLGSPKGGLSLEWIEELLGFVPPYGYRCRENDDQHARQAYATTLIEQGFAPPMLALYILTLRSDYWRVQIGKQITGEPDLVEGLRIVPVIGDPLNLPQAPDAQEDAFQERFELLTDYDLFPSYSSEWHAVRDVLHALDVMALVATGAHEGLKKYLDEYHAWMRA